MAAVVAVAILLVKTMAAVVVVATLGTRTPTKVIHLGSIKAAILNNMVILSNSSRVTHPSTLHSSKGTPLVAVDLLRTLLWQSSNNLPETPVQVTQRVHLWIAFQVPCKHGARLEASPSTLRVLHTLNKVATKVRDTRSNSNHRTSSSILPTNAAAESRGVVKF